MADKCFNCTKGSAAYYATLPAATDSIVVVPLESTDLVSDATMIDYDTLDAILAGASNEQTTMGRKTCTGVTVTVDDTGDAVLIDCDDLEWTATAGNAVGALLFCYQPASNSDDSAILPLAKLDFSFTPDGNTVQAQTSDGYFYKTT